MRSNGGEVGVEDLLCLAAGGAEFRDVVGKEVSIGGAEMVEEFHCIFQFIDVIVLDGV